MGTLWFNSLLAAGFRAVLPTTRDGRTLTAAACNLSSVSDETEEMPASKQAWKLGWEALYPDQDNS